ncbi:MAG: hypothetical protein Fur0018_09540 [Anaerolineales bacterium]
MKTRFPFILLILGILLLPAALLTACEGANLEPLPTNTASPAPTEAPTQAPAPTKASAPPTEAPAPTEAAPAVQVPAVPVGKERRARDWDSDLAAILYGRRVSSSDLVGGYGGVAFDATDCLRCHENAEGVEGQIFYGPNFTAFADDQWPDMLSDPATGLQPVLDSYDWLASHEPKVTYDTGIFLEHILRQNP